MSDKIKEKRKQAVALKYEPAADVAPKVVAKGSGYMAENIIKTAQETGVPLKEDDELIEYLMSLNIYEEIPAELYPIIAEILAFIYRIDGQYR